MRIFISTGEVSGDLQGAMLVESLYREAAAQKIDLEIVALGGEKIKASGAKILADTTAIGSVGLLEALPFIIPTWQIQRLTQKYLHDYLPDILVLIDYPASNIALASYVKQKFPQIKIVYYIAPQDWAVPMLNNAPKIVRLVDKILAIFPEEAKFFQKRQVQVDWVGHPLLDRMVNAPTKEQARNLLNIQPEQQIITLLPASRRQEIKYMLPIIMQAARMIQDKIPDVRFLIPVSLPAYREAIEQTIKIHNLAATIIDRETLAALAAADIAIAKSGTVNLELALLNIPQVVLYRINPVTAWLGRNILKIEIPYMSPPNLIVNREIVPELQQEAANAHNIVDRTLEILLNSDRCSKMLVDYAEMRSLLGEPGVCDRASREIIKNHLKEQANQNL
jgi:lipid-A-disaccharide synthase